MKIYEFVELTELNKKPENERAKLLCFYHLKETGEELFSMALISTLLQQSGFLAPNKSRLKTNLTKGRNHPFLLQKDKSEQLCFVPIVLQQLENEFGIKWNNTEIINSNNE